MSDDQKTIERIIRSRHTSKVMVSPDELPAAAQPWTAEHSSALRQMIETAGWAPFHRRCHEATHRQGDLDSVVPWRFHVLEQSACRALLSYLKQQVDKGDDPAWARAWQSKIKDMLAACGALVQVTWLPDPAGGAGAVLGDAAVLSDRTSNDQAAADRHVAGMDKGAESASTPVMSDNNIEHIAATGAAIQNLLLASEARGWRSYWSSGGILRHPQVFGHLGIDTREHLLGAVFLSPEVVDQATVIQGGLRQQRGDTNSWARWVLLD